MKRFVPVAACAAAVLALTGCAQSPYSVEIAYELDGSAKRASFVPDDLGCVDGGDDGAVGFRFDGEPFYQLSVTAGDPGKIEVGLFDADSVLYFESDDATVDVTRLDDKSVEYSVKAESAAVALVGLEDTAPGELPDLSSVPRHMGSIDATFRCVPDNAE